MIRVGEDSSPKVVISIKGAEEIDQYIEKI